MNRAAALPLLSRRLGASRPAAAAAAVRNYSVQAPKPRRSAFGRLVTYTLVGGTLFYAGSVPLAAVNDDYRDFFAERVPGGDSILQVSDTRSIRDSVRDMHVDDYVRSTANALRSGFSRARSLVEENTQVQQTREQVEKRAAELQDKVRAQLEELRSLAGDEAHVLEDQIKSLRESSSSWLEQAVELSEKSLAQVRAKAAEVAADVQESVSNAVPIVPAPKRVEPAAPAAPVFDELPVLHEAPNGYATGPRERKLQAPAEPSGHLRTDPGAPRLPLLAPSLKSLAGSEPIVAQLASTIDDLATFVRETPSGGAVARGVLEEAQADLKKLVERLDAIKQKDARTLELQLAKQARDYEAELEKFAAEAAGNLEKHDADWEARFKELQNKQVSEFKGRLAKELEVQSALINERLREEVVARGIELQRRWTQEIHAKVEQERAGRLARLDELAKELSSLQEVSLANSTELDVNNGILAVSAALRALRTAIDESPANIRRTFTKELDTLRSARGTHDDQVAGAALDVLVNSKVAETGVESIPTLTEWFTLRLAPRLRSVALLPEYGAGVLSYMVSAAAAPVLAVRRGPVEGDDVQSTVARAEWYLEQRNLDAAAREINQLRGWAKILAADWLAAARRRLETDQALELVDTTNSFNALLRT
ncbi:MICOS complex subunit mic60 [Malassezia cuniculi]|uniref:MICOS complex subunit MIC60 n=1 Tax=Malassezia cuniculi TaxID=948313 RepID=A0AAF0ETL9_9BASI|nr:MICOS complex subunit mic60 [Malassezia cuniculi]